MLLFFLCPASLGLDESIKSSSSLFMGTQDSHCVTWWQLLAVDCCQLLSFIPFMSALVSSEGQQEPSFQSKTVRAEDHFSMPYRVGFLQLAGICLSELIASHWEKWKALFLGHIIHKIIANSGSAKHLLVLFESKVKGEHISYSDRITFVILLSFLFLTIPVIINVLTVVSSFLSWSIDQALGMGKLAEQNILFFKAEVQRWGREPLL